MMVANATPPAMARRPTDCSVRPSHVRSGSMAHRNHERQLAGASKGAEGQGGVGAGVGSAEERKEAVGCRGGDVGGDGTQEIWKRSRGSRVGQAAVVATGCRR